MKRILSLAICSAILLTGCSYVKPYRPDLHQGNIVTSEMVDSLHNGMTRNQVIFLLGTPMLRSAFHENEWDYIYYMVPRFGEAQNRKLKVYFDDDGKVERFESDVMPNETDADLLILGERVRETTLQKKAEKDALIKEQEALEKEQQAVEQETKTDAPKQ